MKSFCIDIYEMLCRKHPNKNIYVISDQHFFHGNIINYERSQFADLSQMHEHIINAHNSVISPDDIVIFLGDFCFRKAGIKSMCERLNGHKYLILGNHDNDEIIKNYPLLGLDGVFLTPVRLNIDYLSHEPLLKGEKDDSHFNLLVSEFAKEVSGINYHGHIHTDEIIGSRFYNTTCEMLDYTPIKIGQTKMLPDPEKPLFINSPYLAQSLEDIKNVNGLDPRIVLEDLIYSYMLEGIKSKPAPYFIHGSYGLYKKYGFISNFSDLDLSVIYDESLSKRTNIDHQKKIVDEAYSKMEEIYGISLNFIKRYASLRIFYALYTSANPYFAKCALDSNLIAPNCYKDSDFITLSKCSTLESFLSKHNPSLVEDYAFPSFTSAYVNPTGDMANLLLQIIFAVDERGKRAASIRKLQYVYKHGFTEEIIKDLTDTFVRFYLKNLALFATWHRYDEIEYIQNEALNNLPKLNGLPMSLQEQIFQILDSKDFIDVHEKIASMPPEETLNTCSRLIRRFK